MSLFARTEQPCCTYPFEDVIFALNTNTGDPEWVQSIGDILSTYSDLTGNTDHNLTYYVYDDSPEDRLEALDVETGEVAWTYSFPGMTTLTDAGSASNIILANGVLYYNTLEQLYAFAAETGTIHYRVPLAEPITSESALSMANNVIYIVYEIGDSEDSFVHAYDALSGDFLDKLPERTASSVDLAPVVTNGRLYVLYDAFELVVYGQ